ncbi:hypothetical protein [Salinibaculum rarum]|uniref:hypothetical protein n=1 Tax=Salinibaculum rarum TaxID=3058903 RepID=UPI00265E8321|nr:hypothetical protein [Salinibaculum sp. KK48]
MDDRRASNLGTGLGLVFGGAIGMLVGLVVGTDLVSPLSYGTGGGIIVGALAGRLVRANRGEDDFAVRVAGGCATVGLFVGAGVGSVGAWAVDASLTMGAAIGAGAGIGHGLAVGSLLLSTLDRPESAE